MKIEGRNAVREALTAGATIERLAVSKDIKDAAGNKLIADARAAGIKITFLDRKVLDKESLTGNHQGFIATSTEFKYSALDEILESAKQKNEDPIVIILDGVEDPHNLGSVIRVAECGGAHGVIIGRHRACSVNETVVKVSAGASAHVLVARVTNINDAIDSLKQRGIWVYACETGGADIYQTDLTGALALVVGGESTGVHRLTKEKCDGVISLPLKGKVNSLNASVACGIALYEALRQRGKAQK